MGLVGFIAVAVATAMYERHRHHDPRRDCVGYCCGAGDVGWLVTIARIGIGGARLMQGFNKADYIGRSGCSRFHCWRWRLDVAHCR